MSCTVQGSPSQWPSMNSALCKRIGNSEATAELAIDVTPRSCPAVVRTLVLTAFY